MGLIKEPLDVDFYVEPKTLTDKEREAISGYIREYKANTAKQKSRKANVKDKPVSKRERSTSR
jgi:hypothetical protein